MANFRISDLTAVSAYADAQEFEVNDSGTSKKITGTQIKTGLLTSPTITGDLTVDTDTLYVDSTNNRVGIGTSSPSVRTHVVEASGEGNPTTLTTETLRVQRNAGSNSGAAMSIVSGTSAQAGLYFGDATSVSSGGVLYENGIDAMVFRANNSERLRIDSSGNVGVGTTSPSSKLDVNGDSTFSGAITEGVYNLTGTALDPSNGTIQTKTLSANTTLTDSFSEGESITLMIDDGTAYTITWPTMTWVNNGGSAPTLATTGYTVVTLWKVSTTLYGALVGDGS